MSGRGGTKPGGGTDRKPGGGTEVSGVGRSTLYVGGGGGKGIPEGACRSGATEGKEGWGGTGAGAVGGEGRSGGKGITFGASPFSLPWDADASASAFPVPLSESLSLSELAPFVLGFQGTLCSDSLLFLLAALDLGPSRLESESLLDRLVFSFDWAGLSSALTTVPRSVTAALPPRIAWSGGKLRFCEGGGGALGFT